MSDRLLGVVGLLLALALTVGAWQIETGLMLDPLGPRTFPIIIVAVLAIASICSLSCGPTPSPTGRRHGRDAGKIAHAVVVMIGYAPLLEPLGFIARDTLGSVRPVLGATGLQTTRPGRRRRRIALLLTAVPR